LRHADDLDALGMADAVRAHLTDDVERDDSIEAEREVVVEEGLDVGRVGKDAHVYNKRGLLLLPHRRRAQLIGGSARRPALRGQRCARASARDGDDGTQSGAPEEYSRPHWQ
jgi:hypothetical protein